MCNTYLSIEDEAEAVSEGEGETTELNQTGTCKTGRDMLECNTKIDRHFKNNLNILNGLLFILR